MKKALICIDYTNDFVASGGKLTCGEPGRLIEDEIVSLTAAFIKNGEYVVFAVDSHEEDDAYHPETRLFPPHNVNGTEGKELFGKLLPVYQKHENEKNVYYMEKTRYSAFAGTDLELKLRERQIEEVHLAGVCTDICVLHTAVDAYNKGFRIVVHKHAVASFNPEGHTWALSHFANSIGAKVAE
ncbi:cysteine hydrolase [Bacillus atrophaeus]|uniref:cysteine hydrolase family protein n=1 Tax=Bacillus atrophaeus TaxID=1452 RepID=UPI00077AE2D1|nr:isochorismatase family cysteine hydrolase [Bacillus atrophaeus]KXZ19872.1 isochorismatase [Bacillus atrophaeus]MCY8495872.1 cysteine hydrolase [Bacillus atrophaeus]MCY8812351.1 cysteine hydrolase [Bacillus atrophaeus]MCY8822805.1 cysteine hydrolase [Bacillus atrophaeus]MCY8827439.1 cysteine hydrolase [Bacillus atrophaeus]